MLEEVKKELEALKKEEKIGRNALNDCMKRSDELKASLFMISGAMQTLEKLIKKAEEAPKE